MEPTLTAAPDWTEKSRSRFALPDIPVLIWLFVGLAIASGVYLFTLSAGGRFGVTEPVWYGRTFNSMLLHLLDGRFDVDPATIGNEGVLHNGLVYAYFGVLPALARLPLMAFPGFAFTDYTRIACLAAVVIMAAFNLLSLATVWRARGRPERQDLLVLFALAILLGGPQIQFLRPSIFQEVILWAGALAAGFVCFALRGYYSERGFSTGVMAGLAVMAGLCLLTRVSTGLGLYIAFGLLWLVLAWRTQPSRGDRRQLVSAPTPLIVSAAIVFVFAGITGFINFMRWGNPLEFTDPHSYIWAFMAPERTRLVSEYGEFNLIRIGYMLAYYFFPIWVLHAADGSLLWSAFQHRVIDSIELPPSSLLVTDPLLIGLAVFCLLQIIRGKQGIDRPVALSLMAGLAVPIGLVLTLASATFRYRMEFYPFFGFSAFLGFGTLLSRAASPPARWFAFAAYGSILAAFAAWLLYGLSPLGSVDTVLGSKDVGSFYRSAIGANAPQVR